MRAEWDRSDECEPGGGSWWLPPAWFVNPNYRRSSDDVLMPFSEKTIKRGLRKLVKDGHISVTKLYERPTKGYRLRGAPRNLY
jgi:hypothetical protein